MAKKLGNRSSPVVAIIGSRGIPNAYGGFESFLEAFCSSKQCKDSVVRVIVYGEQPSNKVGNIEAVRLGVLKSQRPTWYYVKSTLKAIRRADIVMSCGVGISPVAVLVKLAGARLVVHPDGVEWNRSKWTRLQRVLIRLMYYPALVFADHIILDSRSLAAAFPRWCARKSTYIAYNAPPIVPMRQVHNAECKDYALVIARLEPENNIEMIITGFLESTHDHEMQLFIVGAVNTTHYRARLAKYASARIIFLGSIFDKDRLANLRDGARIYFHGHSVGGTNPSLLEILVSHARKISCHDNVYNREVALDNAVYFSESGDVKSIIYDSLGESEKMVNDKIAIRHQRMLSDARYNAADVFNAYLSLLLS